MLPQDVAYLVNASGGGSQISDSTPDSSTTASNAPNIVHATRVSPTTVSTWLENILFVWNDLTIVQILNISVNFFLVDYLN